MHETADLVSYASSLTLSDVPASTIHNAKRLIIDQLGSQIGSAELPWSKQARNAVLRLGSQGLSRTVYFGDQLRADDAAFVNSTFGGGNEIDDQHMGGATHPGAVVIPAAFAVAQSENVWSGEALLLAIITGYEVGLRVAVAAMPMLKRRHHHSPLAIGPFAAAAAVAKLLDLDEPSYLNAIAIAGSHSGGQREYVDSGGSVQRLHTGIGSSAGVRSAYLAAEGITGPHTIIEGPRGFLEAFADRFGLPRLLEGLGENFLLDEVSTKRYHASFRIHAPIAALESVLEEDGLGAEDIESVRVETTSWTLQSVGGTATPRDILEAHFSVRFALAVTARYGSRRLRFLSDEDLRDPATLDLAARVYMEVDEGLERLTPAHWGATVHVLTKDGRTLSREATVGQGSSAEAPADSVVEEKFLDLTESLGRRVGEKILDAVWRLDSINPLQELYPWLVRSPRDLSGARD